MKTLTSTSVFSWHQGELNRPKETMAFLSTHQITSIFQYVSPHENLKKVGTFLREADKNQKHVFFLIGEPEWALDGQATEVIRYIKWASQFQPALKGIVLDIEPHTLNEFKKNPRAVLASFVKGLTTAYALAKQRRLNVTVCLPYYYDTLGFTKELETIIRWATDEVAIMNYYRNKEVEHIQTEAQLCAHHGKIIHTIYELQPPGRHGLTDQQTYYNQGLQAVSKNFEKVQATYAKQDIRLSFHEFRFFKELAEREEKSDKW